MNFRTLKGTIMMAICGAAALFAAGMLLYILVVIFLKGVASLKPHFILFSEINTGMGLGTGIGNAIAGTILLAVISTIIAIPFGVGTAIYLQKYASDNQFTRFLRLMIEVLSGTPSMVLGIFGVAVLVIYLRPITGGESLLAGAMALGVLIIPVIERATEDALSRVPCELEEGSLCTRCDQMADDPEHYHPLCLLRYHRWGHLGIRQGSRRIGRRSPDRGIFPVHAAVQDRSQSELFTRD